MTAKSHWESMKVAQLRRIAPDFGVNPKGKKKKDLIHAMRLAYWKKERSGG